MDRARLKSQRQSADKQEVIAHRQHAITPERRIRMNASTDQNSVALCVDFLNLSDCRTHRVEQDGNQLLVIAEYTPQSCPKCHLRGMPCSGTEDWTIRDAPHLGMYPTLIQLFVPKFRCELCGDVELRPDWLDYERRGSNEEDTKLTEDAERNRRKWRPTRTTRLIKYILHRVGSLATFEQISRETRQTPGAVRSIFKYEFDRWDEARGKDLPIHLSIDEAHYRNNYLGIIADSSGDLGVIDVLPDEKQKTFLDRFYEAGNRDKVETLSTDFRKDSRYAYTRKYKDKDAALPYAEVIGDRFHFSDAIEGGFDAVR